LGVTFPNDRKIAKNWILTLLLSKAAETENYICYKKKKEKMHTKAERKGELTLILPLVSLTYWATLRPLFAFSLAVFDFVRKISDERFHVRMTSQAEGIRFIIKVRMSKIS
jgi:hypothetical protein